MIIPISDGIEKLKPVPNSATNAPPSDKGCGQVKPQRACGLSYLAGLLNFAPLPYEALH